MATVQTPSSQPLIWQVEQSWLTTAVTGHCGFTVEDGKSDCRAGDKGAWVAHDPNHLCLSDLGSMPSHAPYRIPHRMRSFGLPATIKGGWNGAFRYCMQRCNECARCSFISISVKYSDCSWYDECDLANLDQGQERDDFLSGRATQRFKSGPSSRTDQARSWCRWL